MKLLVDNQSPAALARFLDAQGIEAKHVRDVGLDEASDREIWRNAKAHGFAVVSKDEDFLHFANMDLNGPAVVWVRLGNCRKADLLKAFDGILPKLLEALRSGQNLVEVR